MDMMLANLPIQSPGILFATTHIKKKKKMDSKVFNL